MENVNEIQEMASYCLNCQTKPCTKGCPLGNDIPGFIQCVKEKRYKDAYKILCKTTVLPAICGRTCPHEKQCQGHCVRGIKGEPVSIGELEAFVGDMAITKNWDLNGLELASNVNNEKNGHGFIDESRDSSNKAEGKKVAIVGSGPAGLTCAVFLAQHGVDVTIYEKHEKLGGLLRYGIPEFRLSKEVLDRQIEKILDLGVHIVCDKELGQDLLLEELRKEYDAVFLAFGANVSKKMGIPGEDLNGVIGGNELLEYELFPDYTGKKVAVIGGGNVAMDVCRTIKRLGADNVFVIYRRAEEQMPAEKKEIEDAKKEGIEFMLQSNLVSINGTEDGAVTSVECVKTQLVKKAGSDRLVPVDIDGSKFTLDMDYVVMAVGAEAEKGVLNELGVGLNDWGYINVDDNFTTSIPNVYAGGDLVGTRQTVAWAARNGRDAARAILKYFDYLE